MVTSMEPKKPIEPVYGIISSVAYQKRDKHRASISIDGEYAFGVNVSTIEYFRIRKGDEIDSIFYEKIRVFDNGVGARRMAQKYLNHRRRTERDVYRKLKDSGYDTQLIDEIIGELKRAALIDDLAYAKAFIHDRLLTKSISQGKLAQELLAKGVDRRIVAEAMKEVASEDDEISRSIVAARKKLPSIERKETDSRKQSQKLFMFLASRGFSGSTIRKTLERLGQQVEEINAD